MTQHRDPLEPPSPFNAGLEPPPKLQTRVINDQPAPKKRGGLGLIATVAIAVLAKGKSLLLLLKALPAGKFLLTTFSMLAMVWFEAMRSGLLFGVGFVVMILIHELGHGYAMKRSGVEAGWPIFIPFFGAMIAMKGLPRDRATEAQIAFGGPLAGTGAALIAAALGFVTESRPLMALAYTGFFLNLFNLTPISPLDGGRVAQAFSRRAWIIGALLLGALFITTRAPMLLLIGLVALPRIFSKENLDERPLLAPSQQRSWSLRYFGLAAFLGVGSYLTSALLHAASDY